MNTRNPILWKTALIVILIILAGFVGIYMVKNSKNQNQTPPLKIEGISKVTVQQEDQKFIGILLNVKNTSEQVVNNFTAVITVFTPSGDSTEFTFIHLKPIMPDSSAKILNTFEVTQLDPLKVEIYNTPSSQLRFKAKITEFELKK